MIMNLGYRTAPRAFGAVGIAALCVSMGVGCSGAIETQSTERSSRGVRAAAPAPTPSTNNTPSGSAGGPATQPSVTPPVSMTPDPDDAVPPPPAAGAVSFEADVWPIFNTKCGSCHVTIGLGGQNIGSEDKEEALADSVAFEQAILADLEDGSMPPSGCDAAPGGSPGCISVAEFETIESWYEAGSPP